MPPEVDDLLEAYLGEGRPDGTRGEGGGTGVEAPVSSEKPTSTELERMLSAYLTTIDGAQPEDSKFALPRSSDIDDLLRRYVLDQEDVGRALESSLRQHLETSDHPMVAPDASPAAWARQMASALGQTGDLDQRLSKYASAVAGQDEKEHAFKDDHEPTLKGLPPPNAPPLAAGSELAKTIRKKTRSNNQSPV